MKYMFYCSQFNGDISNWNVSNVENMNCMFMYSHFNKDISNWNVSNVKYMGDMFCESKFNVSFPMTEKVNVKGNYQHPLYSWLTNKEQNKLGNFNVSWNFNKFLISNDGELISYFKSSVNPLDNQITDKLK